MTNIWTVVAALGQWACAIATFCAVLVALKPYKRKVLVSLTRLTVKIGGASQVLPICIRIENKGTKTVSIQEAGVCEGGVHVALFDVPIEVEDDGVQTIGVGYEQLLDCFVSKDRTNFRVYVQDSKKYRYYSKLSNY